jgi:hypothetical protein
MKRWNIGLLAAGLAFCGTASAVDVGVMETAEPIQPKQFKLSAYPLGFDRRGTDDDEGAFAVGLGYGLPYGLDVEGLVARSDVGTYYGSDVEWSAWRHLNWVNFSFGGGIHTVDLDGGGLVSGIDTTAIFTFSPTQRLDLNAALDASFEDVNVDEGSPLPSDARFRADNEFETVYFAPGLEFQLTRHLDLLAEVGVGLNGTSDDYAGAGMSWYFGR